MSREKGLIAFRPTDEARAVINRLAQRYNVGVSWTISTALVRLGKDFEEAEQAGTQSDLAAEVVRIGRPQA